MLVGERSSYQAAGLSSSYSTMSGDAVCAAVERTLPIVDADSVSDLGLITLDLPKDLSLGAYELELLVYQQGAVISRNFYEVQIVGPAD